MYIRSDFAVAEQPQEDHRKKGSIAPWLVGGGILAGGAGLTALALASKGKAQPNVELVKKGADDAKKVIQKASGYKGLSKEARKAKIESRKQLLDGTQKLITKSEGNEGSRQIVNKSISRTNLAKVDLTKRLAKQKGTQYNMKYTTTADFAMAGAIGGEIKTGVLSRITGQLGNTVDKAKNWLSKAGQAKQEIGGSAALAKNRQAYVSPNAGAEAIAKRKYGQPVVNQAALDRGQAMKSNLGKLASDKQKSVDVANTQASQTLGASTRNNNYQYAKKAQAAGILTNAGTGSTTDGLKNQQSLRLRYFFRTTSICTTVGN